MSRYTVEDAAAVLGMTTGAVRNRLSQGTLRSVEEHGTVYVLLPTHRAPDAAPRDTGDIPGEFLLPADISSRDTAQDTARVTGDIPGESSALMSEMRERIASLERERGESSALMSEMRDRIAFLERERERKDTILLNIAEAMKDISSPTEQPGRVGPREQPLEGAAEERRSSWWSRIFGR